MFTEYSLEQILKHIGLSMFATKLGIKKLFNEIDKDNNLHVDQDELNEYLYNTFIVGDSKTK